MTDLVFIGGFLGSGKTTLILHAAKLLARRGLRVGVIMNDQADGLVDTEFAAARDLAATEVAGGCFCCRFSDLLAAAGRLRAFAPDVIFAEPVGSCIDLSATILQPLQAYHHDEFRLAPLTVLVDPGFQPANEDVAYLYRNQLAEADLVCLSKSDLYPGAAFDTACPTFILSARTGAGVAAWLAEVLEGGRVAGSRLLEVDYRRYADAEAALGWLNLHADVRLRTAASPATVAGPLLDRLQTDLRAAGLAVAHLKIFDRGDSGHVKVSLVSTDAEPLPDGDLMAEPSLRHELIVNLRALGDPVQLDSIVRAAVAAIPGKIEIRQARAFRPAPPRPSHRFVAQAVQPAEPRVISAFPAVPSRERKGAVVIRKSLK